MRYTPSVIVARWSSTPMCLARHVLMVDCVDHFMTVTDHIGWHRHAYGTSRQLESYRPLLIFLVAHPCFMLHCIIQLHPSQALYSEGCLWS